MVGRFMQRDGRDRRVSVNVGPPSRAGSRVQEREEDRRGGAEGRSARRQFAPTDPYGRWFFLPWAPLEGPPSIFGRPPVPSRYRRNGANLLRERIRCACTPIGGRAGFLMDRARNNTADVLISLALVLSFVQIRSSQQSAV